MSNWAKVRTYNKNLNYKYVILDVLSGQYIKDIVSDKVMYVNEINNATLFDTSRDAEDYLIDVIPVNPKNPRLYKIVEVIEH